MFVTNAICADSNEFGDGKVVEKIFHVGRQ